MSPTLEALKDRQNLMSDRLKEIIAENRHKLFVNSDVIYQHGYATFQELASHITANRKSQHNSATCTDIPQAEKQTRCVTADRCESWSLKAISSYSRRRTALNRCAGP